MAENLLEAFVAFIEPAMAEALSSTPETPKVWTDYAGEVDYPYAVVTDGNEAYAFQSGNPATYICDGVLQVAFYATSKAEARQLARSCIVAVLNQDFASDNLIVFDDGILLELRPAGAFSQVITDTATNQASAFARVVNFQFKEQFPTF